MDKHIMTVATALFLSFFVLIAVHALILEKQTTRAQTDMPALADMVRR